MRIAAKHGDEREHNEADDEDDFSRGKVKLCLKMQEYKWEDRVRNMPMDQRTKLVELRVVEHCIHTSPYTLTANALRMKMTTRQYETQIAGEESGSLVFDEDGHQHATSPGFICRYAMSWVIRRRGCDIPVLK